MLHPGDTMVIGPGTYQMDNSLLIPSGVPCAGTRARRFCSRAAAERSWPKMATWRELFGCRAGKFRPGMGSKCSTIPNSGWDVSISKIDAVNGKIPHLNPMTVRDYDSEQKHGRIQILSKFCAP
jgi:hypothetical protein